MKDRTFCITGKLDQFETKASAYEAITARGANAIDTLTMDCDYLVIAAKGSPNYAQGAKGNKLIKAESLIRSGHPMRIITESQLVDMLEQAPLVSDNEQGINFEHGRGKRLEIEDYTVDGLKINAGVSLPRDGIRQVLRLTYSSSDIDETSAANWREVLQSVKPRIRDDSLRCSLRTDILPANWGMIEEDNSSATASEVLLQGRLTALLDTRERTTTSRQLLNTIVEILRSGNLTGNICARVWDEDSRYGFFWIQRLWR